jgi:hypothetical protein
VIKIQSHVGGDVFALQGGSCVWSLVLLDVPQLATLQCIPEKFDELLFFQQENIEGGSAHALERIVLSQFVQWNFEQPGD